jgi:membrane-associated protease RseP (regulator of RpoE activity)
MQILASFFIGVSVYSRSQMITPVDQGKDQRRIDNVIRLLADLCEVEAWYRRGELIDLTLSSRWLEPDRAVQVVRERLTTAGYRFTISEQGERFTVSVNPKPRIRIPRLNILLFLATLVTVYVFPVFERNLAAVDVAMSKEGIASPQSFGAYIALIGKMIPRAWDSTLVDLRAGAGLVFAVALISILLIHEMGHYIASRRRGLAATWPYFIPAPTLIGTFGAVIKSKSPFWNRRDLIEVGAAGPIAGWVVAMGWLIYGLMHATITTVDAGSVKDIAFYLQGESVLVQTLTPLLAGSAPQGFVYVFPEAAFAGWVGLLVTAINLLPIGQLDGGHIVYGLLPDMQKRLAWVAMVGLGILGLQSPMWWFFALMGIAFGVGHPPTVHDGEPAGRTATIMGTTAMIILILSFTPMPFG